LCGKEVLHTGVPITAEFTAKGQMIERYVAEELGIFMQFRVQERFIRQVLLHAKRALGVRVLAILVDVPTLGAAKDFWANSTAIFLMMTRVTVNTALPGPGVRG
jgi:hypothetical protein